MRFLMTRLVIPLALAAAILLAVLASALGDDPEGASHGPRPPRHRPRLDRTPS